MANSFNRLLTSKTKGAQQFRECGIGSSAARFTCSVPGNIPVKLRQQLAPPGAVASFLVDFKPFLDDESALKAALLPFITEDDEDDTTTGDEIKHSIAFCGSSL
jgi:hypothetical protein